MPSTARNAAEYLVVLAARECPDDPDYLTPLKLQKLLYYLQGWAYAEWGRPFFEAPIEAWRDGPVVREVYNAYKGRETLPIVPGPSGPEPDLTSQQKALIHSVWDAYKGFSGHALRDMTHEEAPYKAVYRAQDSQGRCNEVIDPEAIRKAFVGRASRRSARLSGKRDRLRSFAAANTRGLVGRDVF